MLCRMRVWFRRLDRGSLAGDLMLVLAAFNLFAAVRTFIADAGSAVPYAGAALACLALAGVERVRRDVARQRAVAEKQRELDDATRKLVVELARRADREGS
jgi:hypothetical protein